jgi:MHS family proline/betaine transporter-like MFS transporter
VNYKPSYIHSFRKPFFLAALGNVVEFYEFSIYSFLIPIISTLFFPTANKIASLIMGYSIFALSFLARPIGSIIFGYIGDKKGRRFSLSISLLGMAISTTAMGFLPTYSEIGIWASLSLAFLRLIHGICLGGEFTGSLIFLVEHMSEKQKYEHGSLVTSSLVSATIIGWFLGSGVCLLIQNYPSCNNLWRVPFLLSAFTTIIGFLLRRKSLETSEFLISQKNTYQRIGIKDLFKTYFWIIALIFISGGLIGVLFYGLFIFPNVFLATLIKTNSYYLQLTTTAGIGLYMVLLPLMGFASDRIGTKRVMQASAILTMILSYPIFKLLSNGTIFSSLIAEALSALLISGFMAPTSFLITQLFPTQIRYFSVSCSYNLGVSLMAGITPLIFTQFILKPNGFMNCAIYLCFCAFLVIVVSCKVPNPIKLRS